MSRTKSRSVKRASRMDGRAPARPLLLTLEEHFATHSLIGLLAAQQHEPDPQWATDWSFRMGRTMAREALRRRRLRKQ
jgi:hypothetical protein